MSASASKSPRKSPQLILVSGPPGAGKSTLARELSRLTGIALLDKDCIDEPFSPGIRGARYAKEIEPRSLQSLLNLAELNLGSGVSVMLDAPWTHLLLGAPGKTSAWARKLRALARRRRARLVVLECVISEGALRARLARRGFARDGAKLTDAGWARFKRDEQFGVGNPLPHHRIDLELPRAEALRQALQALRAIQRAD